MDYKNNKNMLVGIKGNIGSGKTESSKILNILFPFVEYAMADPLKKIGDILGFTKEELYGTQDQKLEKNKHWNISSREFLQVFGTDVCREFLPKKIPQMDNIWIHCFEIFCSQNRDTNIIVSDVRFVNEAESIRNLGGIIIEIQRPDNESDEWENVSVNDYKEHISESESAFITPDFILQNDSDIENLTRELTKIIIKQYF
jgi:hypothetical protein